MNRGTPSDIRGAWGSLPSCSSLCFQTSLIIPADAGHVAGAVVQVVGEDLVLVADDHLVAQDDRVVGEHPVLGDRGRRERGPPHPTHAEAARARGHRLQVDAPLQRADVDRPGHDLGAGRRPGEGRPAAVGLRGRRELVAAERLGDDLAIGPLAAGELAGRAGIGPVERREVRGGRRFFSQGRAAEELLGRHPRQVDARVGMDQADLVLRAVGHELAVHRQRLVEPAVLERQVAQQLERIVAPRAAERLIDDPPQQTPGRGRSAPWRYQRSAWPSTRAR